MMRVRLLLIGLILLLPMAAVAQPSAALSPEQARTALEVLNNPRKRAEVASTLEAIAAAKPDAAPAQPAATDKAPPPAAKPGPAPAAGTAAPAQPASSTEALKIPLAPDSLGAQVLVSASDFLTRAGRQTMDALHAVQSVPLLWGWMVVMATNPWARSMLDDTVWRLLVVMACALAVEYALRRMIARPITALERMAPGGTVQPEPSEPEILPPDVADPLLEPDEAPDEPPEDAEARAEAGDTEPSPHPQRRRVSNWTQLRRIPLVFARLLLDLIPVLGFVVTGHLLSGSALGGQAISRLVLLAVVDSYAVCIILLSVARMLLSPARARLRLFNLRDDIASYLMRWTRRLVVIGVFGYAVAEVGLLLGLSDVAHEAVLKTVSLALHIGLAIIVVQKRRAVRARIRAPAGETGFAARLRNGLAASWHWIALFFIIGVWVVWAVEVPHGFAWFLRIFVITALVLIGARLTLIVLLGSIDRALRIAPEVSERYPGLEARVRLYAPMIHGTVRFLLFTLCFLGLLQLYGLPTFTWFAGSALGQRVVSACGTMFVTVLIALAVWEAANAAIHRHLAKLQKEAQIARSARLRTLLPLLRSGLMISILTVAGLMLLSEIGLNIAPLLAGAGIIGVAIGFGSQKLVQDLITGIFLLLENAMQVGDVVNVAGHAGVVESLSVRTIRLRSEDGSVHVIPFSSVTTVTNMTKDYSRAVISAGVAYKEDYDGVVEVLRTIAKEMRGEPQWKTVILDDLEVWGLDQLGDSSVVIKCRIMCTPFGRWSVQREFNRRMKKRFDELGIEIPFPHRKLVLEGVLPLQAAPPAQLPPPAAEAATAVTLPTMRPA
ncbi:MAG TPA: mechanosensitive ion channel domain-containing protein [Acetobacteraceae bacterium]|nr:mechanosensitive ion channel domain-containing protein [Acetobacteraceae bacterium]